MFGLVRKHLVTVLVAMVTAAVTAGGPAMADIVREAWFAHNADKLDGIDSTGFLTTGSSFSGGVNWGSGLDFVELGTTNVNVGPGSRHVLIIGETNVWSGAPCEAHIRLEWQGLQRDSTLVGMTVAACHACGNGKDSAVTTAMPVLPAGVQTIKMWGGSTGCGFEGTDLQAVVLDN